MLCVRARIFVLHLRINRFNSSLPQSRHSIHGRYMATSDRCITFDFLLGFYFFFLSRPPSTAAQAHTVQIQRARRCDVLRFTRISRPFAYSVVVGASQSAHVPARHYYFTIGKILSSRLRVPTNDRIVNYLIVCNQ